MATCLRLREITVWEYFVIYDACALIRQARMSAWIREMSGWSGEIVNKSLCDLGLRESSVFCSSLKGTVAVVGTVVGMVVGTVGMVLL